MAELLGLLGLLVAVLSVVCVHLQSEITTLRHEMEILAVEVGNLRARVKTHDKIFDDIDNMVA